MNEKSANNLKKPKLFNKKGKILCINRLAEPEKSKIDYIWRFIVISVLLIIFGYLTSLGCQIIQTLLHEYIYRIFKHRLNSIRPPVVGSGLCGREHIKFKNCLC